MFKKFYTFEWWEVVLFKIAVLSLGIAMGAYWKEVFVPLISGLVVLGLLIGLYTVLFRHVRSKNQGTSAE